MRTDRGFEVIKKISFVRTGGSKEESVAANIIIEECEALKVEAYTEDFPVDGYREIKASLRFFKPDFEVECVGVGMSGTTGLEGVRGEFCYITSIQDAMIQDVNQKICLVHSKLVNYKLYKILCDKKAAALVLCCGDIYNDKELVDLDPYMYRERHYTHGKIPAVCIRMKDADAVMRQHPAMAEVVMIEEEFEAKSRNVVATIEGSTYKNEIIAFTAHYDSVSYSQGSYDNATGVAALINLMAYFQNHQPLRTIKFIFCGSEEMGLLGSKAYVEAHKEQLLYYKLCINIDMIGVTIGEDIACCTSSPSLVSYIKYLSCETGFPISAKQGVYSSDSSPFADKGVPAVSFARIAPQGGAKIHSRLDVDDYLEESNFYNTCEFIQYFASRLINAKAFPVEYEIPEKMKEELDYYFGRKERKE